MNERRARKGVRCRKRQRTVRRLLEVVGDEEIVLARIGDISERDINLARLGIECVGAERTTFGAVDDLAAIEIDIADMGFETGEIKRTVGENLRRCDRASCVDVVVG